MTTERTHISVCVCTYKRSDSLRRLVRELCAQETGGLFTHSIVIADNDRQQSAKAEVLELAGASAIPITYCVEPRQNIALARNRAVENAQGDFLAFIDDDEFPARDWLLTLFRACKEYGADGVLGPVKRHFDQEPPRWIIKGHFYERPTYPTGLVIDWSKGRTNNVLVRRRIIPADAPPFRPEFRTGEDQDFFRRMIERGHVFVWCNEAVAYEIVSPVRWKRTFMLRRALLQGSASVLHPTFGAREAVKAIVAIPAYLAALPFALLWAHHRFMGLLVKLSSHAGALLALLHINLIKEPYVTE